MAINLFLNRLEREEFIEIQKIVIFLLYRKAPLSKEVISFITHLAKSYHFTDQEMKELFWIDVRYGLEMEQRISHLTKHASKMLLFFLVLYAEIFDEIALEEIYDAYGLSEELPISKKIQKRIRKTTQAYIDETIIMHHFLYDKKIPFYLEIAHDIDVLELSNHKDQHFFIVDNKKLSRLKESEKYAFLWTLKQLMLDDNHISTLEEEALKFWCFYLGFAYEKLQDDLHFDQKGYTVKKLWLKNFLLFSYLITQKNYEKSLKNAQAVLSITPQQAKRLIANVKSYKRTIKKVFQLIFSEQMTHQDETKAKGMNVALALGELLLFAFPKTMPYTITRKLIGTPITQHNQGKIGIKELQAGNPHQLVIAIDGFLTEGDTKQFDDWMQTLPYYYPHATIAGFQWRSQRLETIIDGGIATWYRAVEQTLDAAKILSAYILQQKKAYPESTITLMGHSLGARVIFNTLHTLLESNTEVERIYLFGGAVSNDRVNWSDVADAVSDIIYNFYSKYDQVLKNLYQVSMVETPIGLKEIKLYHFKETQNVTVKNFNVTHIVKGHSAYKPQLDKIFKACDIEGA